MQTKESGFVIQSKVIYVGKHVLSNFVVWFIFRESKKEMENPYFIYFLLSKLIYKKHVFCNKK